MQGSATPLLPLLGKSLCQYLVPVYQRPYSWTERHCGQLFDDLERLLREGRTSHFFGSVVLKDQPYGGLTMSQVIDGQQRLTTLSLLLLTLRDLLREGTLSSPGNSLLQETITVTYLTNQFQTPEHTPRLRLNDRDWDTWRKLLDSRGDEVSGTRLALNQAYLADRLRRSDFSPEQLYDGLTKLMVICISLDEKDDPQLIFESLNATGLALTEGDKIRNFLLMDLPPAEQERLYTHHWRTLEQAVGDEVSALFRDFLSIKRKETPRLDEVYVTFKHFFSDSATDRETLLAELVRYAKRFQLLRKGGKDHWPATLRGSLARLNRLDVAVMRPFALEVLRRHDEGALTLDELTQIFAMMESYLLRRSICEVFSGALAKIFLTLDGDIARLRHGDARYVDVLAYVLCAKTGSGRFPDDAEFGNDLATRAIYKMNKVYRQYLFERLENGGTIETKDVYTLLDDHTYSIEHILPQRPTPSWREAIGERFDEIHATWLHRLGNLTLTGYNSELSNATFLEKRDAANGGYRTSGLRLNQYLGQLDHWGEAELQARTHALCAQALAIWPRPSADFKPLERECDSFTLADEDPNITNRKPVRFQWHGDAFPVKTWAELVDNVMRMLLKDHLERLRSLAKAKQCGLASTATKLVTPKELAEGLFFEKNGSTEWRVQKLRDLFACLGEVPEALTIFLQSARRTKGEYSSMEKTYLAYWTYALPTLKEQCSWLSNRNPTVNGEFMTRRPGVHGYELHYVVRTNCARVLMAIWLKDAQTNKIAFDKLYQHQAEIEERFGASLNWERYDQGRVSWVEYTLPDVDVRNEADWPKMLAFHKEWGLRLWEAVLPFIPKEEEL